MSAVEDTLEEFEEWFAQLMYDVAFPGVRELRNVRRRLQGKAPLKPPCSPSLGSPPFRSGP